MCESEFWALMEVGDEKIRVIREDFMHMSEAVGLKLSPILPSTFYFLAAAYLHTYDS